MAKKITQKKVVQTDLWQNTIDSTESLIKLVESLNKELKETTEITKKALKSAGKTDFKGLKTTNEEIEKLNKNFDQKLVIDKERVKLQNKLKVATSEQVKQNTELRVQIQEQNKANKQAAKERLNLVGSYERESKTLIKLRKEYKDLIITEGKATKQSNKLLKEITKLDRELKEVDASAGQFQREVGNYPETFGAAAKSAAKLAAGFLSIKAASDGVGSSLTTSTEGSESLREASSKLEGVTSKVKDVVASAALDFFEYAKGVATGERALTDVEGAFERTASSTENFADDLNDSADAFANLTKAQIQFEKDSRPVEQRIEVLNGEIEKQQIIAGDSTKSFAVLNEAILEGQRLQIERSRLLQGLAESELKLIQQEIEAKEISGTVGVELLDKETEAIIKLQAARNDLRKEVGENAKELNQINQDLLERDLDILIDGFDNQKTINERRIANEKTTLDERQSLQNRTVKLGQQSFNAQVETIRKFTDVLFDEKELLELSSIELNKRIRSLGLSEIIEGRLLEVIRDRKSANQDLLDSQNDLNDANQEALDIQKDIEAQEIALNNTTNESLKNLEEKREDDNIESLMRRLSLAEEGSIEFLRIEQELNNALLEEEKERLSEEELLEKKSLEKRKENREKVLTVLTELNNKFFNDQKAKADEEINDTKERQKQLQDLAANGNREAAENLANNQKEQAEANRKKEELLRKEKQFELALAVINAFNAELDSGKPTGQALASAISSTTVLTSFVSSLPSFYEGTENTGNGGNLDSNGGFNAILHKNERVMTEDQNNRMGGLSNNNVAGIVEDYNKGLLYDLNDYNTPKMAIKDTSWQSNKQILDKFDNLEGQLKRLNEKESYLGSDVDTMKKLISKKYQKGNTKTTLTSKAPSVW